MLNGASKNSMSCPLKQLVLYNGCQILYYFDRTREGKLLVDGKPNSFKLSRSMKPKQGWSPVDLATIRK